VAWNCNNACHVITTDIARQIIAANSPSTLPVVKFTDIDGSVFRVTVSDAPCLKIVLDLKDGGGLVLQHMGILLNNLGYVRNESYSSDALQQLRCAALCPVPFNVQLSETVELVVCKACDTCSQPESIARYLMLITFFLGLLLLLYFLSLLCYFWRNWLGGGCGVCAPGFPQNTGRASIPVVPPPPAIIAPEKKTDQPVFDLSVLNQLPSDALLVLQGLLNTSDLQPFQ
jgi:hypothetical protein